MITRTKWYRCYRWYIYLPIYRKIEDLIKNGISRYKIKRMCQIITDSEKSYKSINGFSFLGRKMTQSELSLWLFEKILSSVDFKRVIEFGTKGGALSNYFALFCQERKADFYTYDIVDKELPLIVKNYFEKLDIFQNVKKIGEIISKTGQTFLFCDNGDKIREFNEFVPYLKSGDIIAVHDWNNEITRNDIGEVICKYNLKDIFEEECQTEGFIKIFYKV